VKSPYAGSALTLPLNPLNPLIEDPAPDSPIRSICLRSAPWITTPRVYDGAAWMGINTFNGGTQASRSLPSSGSKLRSAKATENESRG
jgi:hypothetical protein